MVMADLVGCTGLLVYKYATNEPDKNAGLGEGVSCNGLAS